jgi:signal transduction histidine kinase
MANTGPLVPPDQVSRLLEPFQRAAPDRTASPPGLGLGLSIVADVAKAHGAGLEVRPRPGGGLTVAVSFPRVPRHSSLSGGVLHHGGRRRRPRSGGRLKPMQIGVV